MSADVDWITLFAVMLALHFVSAPLGWPTLGALIRNAVQSRSGTTIFVALWLWAGWHFLIRGWHFFLQGHGPSTGAGSAQSLSLSSTLVQVVLTLGVLYLVLLFGIRAGYRAWRSTTTVPETAPSTVAFLAAGYALFIASMGLFELLAGHSAHGIFTSAVRDGAFLAFVVACPLFLVLAFLTRLARTNRSAVPK